MTLHPDIVIASLIADKLGFLKTQRRPFTDIAGIKFSAKELSRKAWHLSCSGMGRMVYQHKVEAYREALDAQPLIFTWVNNNDGGTFRVSPRTVMRAVESSADWNIQKRCLMRSIVETVYPLWVLEDCKIIPRTVKKRYS